MPPPPASGHVPRALAASCWPAALRLSFDAVIVADARARIVEWNDAAAQLFGLAREAALGRRLSEFLRSSEEDLERATEITALRPDGTETPCEVRSQSVESDGQTFQLLHLRDVAEERRLRQTAHDIEEQARQLERQVTARSIELERFASLARMTTDIVGFADMQQRVLYMNPAGRKTLGWPPESQDGPRTVAEVFPPPSYQQVVEVVIPTALQGGLWIGELTVNDGRGGEIPVSMVGMIERGKDGEPAYMCGVLRDVSERLRTEAELQRSLAAERELNRLKTSFVSLVSHEFRTPLGIIVSSSEILNLYYSRLDPSERESHLDAIKHAALRMSSLMEEVLFFSRVEASRVDFLPEPFDFETLCEHLRDEAFSATAGQCPIELVKTNELAGACGDEEILRHIFSNLLSNGVKYSPPGSPVVFAVERRGPHAVCEIRDSGIGIPTEELPKLFTAFYRANNVSGRPGTGLGLAIVKKCVDLHGGEIVFESTVGRGTTARVTLPLYPPPHGKNPDH